MGREVEKGVEAGVGGGRKTKKEERERKEEASKEQVERWGWDGGGERGRKGSEMEKRVREKRRGQTILL